LTRRVLIVGATSAIAEEASRCFAAEHARLMLAARDAAKLEIVADDLRVRGAESVCVMAGDLADDATRQAMISHAATEWGGLDSALIAYGILPDQALCEGDAEALRRALEVNCASVAAWMMALGEILEKQRSGVLAVIGSVAGDRGRRSNYVYGAAKAAIATLAAGLRPRLASAGVRVVLVKPGWVSTPMTAHLPQNFLYASPEAVGRGIYQAMLAGRSVVYLPWYWRWIMMAIRMIPEPLFVKLNL